MKFVDEAVVKVQAGDGGSGVVSFWREKFILKVALMVATVVMVVMYTSKPMKT